MLCGIDTQAEAYVEATTKTWSGWKIVCRTGLQEDEVGRLKGRMQKCKMDDGASGRSQSCVRAELKGGEEGRESPAKGKRPEHPLQLRATPISPRALSNPSP